MPKVFIRPMLIFGENLSPNCQRQQPEKVFRFWLTRPTVTAAKKLC
jgi:hypothetical protein